MSILGSVFKSFLSMVVISENIGTDGQCFFNIFRQNGLISQKATICMLAASKPIEKPPMPEKTSRTFNTLAYYFMLIP
jgi:hypothetical protein